MKHAKKIKKHLLLVLGCFSLSLLFACSEGDHATPSFVNSNSPSRHLWYSPLSGAWVYEQTYCTSGAPPLGAPNVDLILKKLFKRILEPARFDLEVHPLSFSEETSLSFFGIKADSKTHELHLNVNPKIAASSSLVFPLFYSYNREGLLPHKADSDSFWEADLTTYYSWFSAFRDSDILVFNLGSDFSLCSSGKVELELKRQGSAGPSGSSWGSGSSGYGSSGSSGSNQSSSFNVDKGDMPKTLEQACQVLELDPNVYGKYGKDGKPVLSEAEKSFVRKTWGRLSLSYHSDKGAQSDDKMQQINAAKDLLLPKPTQGYEP